MTDRNPTDRIDRVIDGVIRQMMADEGPADLRRRVLARMEEDASKPGWFVRRPTPGSLPIWAGGAVMALVVVLLSIWSSNLWRPTERLKPEHSEAAHVSGVPKSPAIATPPAPDPTVATSSTGRAAAHRADTGVGPYGVRRKRVPVAAASDAPADADSIQIAPVSAKVALMEFVPVGPAQMTFDELSVERVEIKAMELPPLSTGSAVPPLR